MFDKGDYQISGQIVDEFDMPVSQARVEMTSVIPNLEYNSTSYRYEVTDIHGRFSFTKLGGHEHQIVVEATGYEITTLNYQFQFVSNDLEIILRRNDKE